MLPKFMVIFNLPLCLSEIENEKFILSFIFWFKKDTHFFHLAEAGFQPQMFLNNSKRKVIIWKFGTVG